MQNYEQKLQDFMLGHEISELMQELGYELRGKSGCLYYLLDDPCAKKRVVVDFGGRPNFLFQEWNDEEDAPRWFTVANIELPTYRVVKLTILEWMTMLHLGQQISLNQIAIKANEKTGLNIDKAWQDESRTIK